MKIGRKKSSRPFWQRKTLEQMTSHEWELICDGCGKCCCFRATKDTQHGEKIACELLDPEASRCTNYPNRKKIVSDCFQITPKNIHTASWLPSSCSYRLLAQGRSLPRWHHLISKSRETVHAAGRSVRGLAITASTFEESNDL